MTNHVYKTVELTGSSPNGLQAAVENAVARANDTIRNIRWFEVTQVRGQVEAGKIAHWQVTMKLGFTLEGE
jgi:flavin-binding protein dodecin